MWPKPNTAQWTCLRRNIKPSVMLWRTITGTRCTLMISLSGVRTVKIKTSIFDIFIKIFCNITVFMSTTMQQMLVTYGDINVTYGTDRNTVDNNLIVPFSINSPCTINMVTSYESVSWSFILQTLHSPSCICNIYLSVWFVLICRISDCFIF